MASNEILNKKLLDEIEDLTNQNIEIRMVTWALIKANGGTIEVPKNIFEEIDKDCAITRHSDESNDVIIFKAFKNKNKKNTEEG